MKPAKRILLAQDGSALDSPEELWMTWYLEEARRAGYVESWRRADTFIFLNDVPRRTVKPPKESQRDAPTRGKANRFAVVDGNQLQGARYTPDFTVHWTDCAKGIFWQDIQDDPRCAWIPFQCSTPAQSILEVKPFFDRMGKTAFALNQIKWVWQLHRVFVQLVKIGTKASTMNQYSPGLFDWSFTPARFLLTDQTGRARTLHFKARTLSEFVARQRRLNAMWDAAVK